MRVALMLGQQSNSLFSHQILLSYGFSAGFSNFKANNEREKEKEVKNNNIILTQVLMSRIADPNNITTLTKITAS